MTKRPKGMDFGTYKAMCAAKGTTPLDEAAFKALPVDEGSDDEGESGGSPEPDGDEGNGGEGGGDNAPEPDDDEDDASKGLGIGDLRKALQSYKDVEGAAGTAVGGSRETYLSARLASGKITKSERAELGRIWAGTEANPAVDASGRPLRKSLTEYLDPESREVVDAQPFLKSLLGGVNERLDGITARHEASAEGTRQLLLAQGALIKSLGGALLDVSTMLNRQQAINKALEARLGIVESTPATPRAVRSAGANGTANRPLNKSVTGAGNGSGQDPNALKKSIVRGFHTLVKGAGEGNDFATAARLTEECAVFERTGHLQPGTKAALRALAG